MPKKKITKADPRARHEAGKNDRDSLFQALRQIADAIVETFPRAFEVVIHDLSQPHKSIRHIVGDVTKRRAGGPVTDLVVKALQQEGDEIRDRHNYKTTTKDGRTLKSTSVFIRDGSGAVAAAFCINFDMTDYLSLVHALDIFTTTASAFNGTAKVETFATSIKETIVALFEQEASKIGKQAAYMNTGEKMLLVKRLKENGVFQIRGAVDQVAHLLGITRYTVYNYLKNIETQQSLGEP
jgi:predicted transcriptional regulator YheO